MLPQTEMDMMNAIKGSLSSFLAFLVVGGDLIAKIREKIQFITVFSTDEQLKQEFKTVLANIPGPHTLISLDAIQQTKNYASQL